ncbi:hypothetical protein MSPP1_002753 [Malassezia sp. CBS 17886]|nr:hypothetical protein MSPP1_002753 [Malassezia sp. CBS 17886]
MTKAEPWRGAAKARNMPPTQLARPTIPDLRMEQFFLATVRHMVDIPAARSADASDLAAIDVAVSAPQRTTAWHHTRHIAWYAASTLANDRLPLIRAVVYDQIIAPLWQGVLWGLGGVAFTNTRQAIALARGRRTPVGGRGGGWKGAAKEAAGTAGGPGERSLFARWLSHVRV